jgi:hypothetical protein
MTAATFPNIQESFRQAAETFENAVKTGAAFQEDSARRFAEMLRNLGSPMDWQKKTQAGMNEAMQISQKNFGEAIRVMNHSAKSAMELFQKTLEACRDQQEGDPDAKNRELWESVLKTLRTNVEVVLQANAQMMESWSAVAKRFGGAPNNGHSSPIGDA